jgi:hypothetical protein
LSSGSVYTNAGLAYRLFIIALPLTFVQIFSLPNTLHSFDFIHKGYEVSGLLVIFADGSGRIAHINSSFAVDLQPPSNILSLFIVDTVPCPI